MTCNVGVATSTGDAISQILRGANPAELRIAPPTQRIFSVNRSALQGVLPELVRRDCLAGGETDPLLTGYGEMACEPRSDTAVHDSHAAGVGAGEPRTATTSRRVEGAPAAPTADGDGPALLGRAVEAVEELAEFSAGGAARDRGAVAPSGLQALLGMEESTLTGSARDWEGSAGSHSADEPRQSSLGSTTDPRRAAEAGPDGLAGDGSKYMPRQRRPPSQVWRPFLKNHAQDLIALEFFTVPTATFRVLFVLVVLSHGRRRLRHFNITEHPTAEWTGDN